MTKCNQCPRRCNALRNGTENIGGFCRMPNLPRIARAGLHFWEEPCISGKHGSGTVFFSGCSLKCVYCQNFDISHNGFGKNVSIERLAEIFKELESKGAENINLVNPTHYIGAIKEALKIYKPNIPIVYNSSGYDSIYTVNNGFTDVYLFDFKYCDNEKSLKYSAAADYFTVATNAIKKAYDLIGKCKFDDSGIMQSGIIIRHLLLPSSTNDAIRIIDWAAENCKNAVFSLMSQYVPMGKADEYKEINRRITAREYDKVCNHLMEKDFCNIYVQERESANTAYIPEFNLEGV